MMTRPLPGRLMADFELLSKCNMYLQHQPVSPDDHFSFPGDWVPDETLSFSASGRLCSFPSFGSRMQSENTMRGTVRQMPVIQRRRCVCRYASTAASLAGVPIGFAAAKVKGSAYISAPRVALPTLLISSPGSTWLQIAPEIELPTALPIL